MIWRSLICSSLALIAAQGATVTGVEQADTLTDTMQLRDSREDAVNKHKDYAGIVVSLTPVGQPPPVAPAKHVVMLQKNKEFIPHVLPVVAGSFVDFPNSVLIFH